VINKPHFFDYKDSKIVSDGNFTQDEFAIYQAVLTAHVESVVDSDLTVEPAKFKFDVRQCDVEFLPINPTKKTLERHQTLI
jgi:hypothetical protein